MLTKQQKKDAELLDEVYEYFRLLKYGVGDSIEMVKAWATFNGRE